MRFTAFLAGAALSVLAQAAWAQPTCSFVAQSNSTIPALTGRVVYQEDYTDPTTMQLVLGALFLYDFQSKQFTTIPLAAWGLTLALNPVFSPDGKAILFSAVSNNQRHLYYWKIASASPVNLTGAMGNLRNEDPKFSAHGDRIVWKQTFNIVTAPLIFDASGNPSLGAVMPVTTNGVQGTSTEASGPVFSPTGKYIYYFTGSKSDATIYQFDLTNPANPSVEPFPQATGTEYYYPVDPDLYDFFYVSWPDPATKFDKIYQFSRATQTSVAWNTADCGADNSDPAPADEDYFIFSRDNNLDKNGSRYELYIGKFVDPANPLQSGSSPVMGMAWSLSPAGLNGPAGNKGNFEGANYTTAR
jgi:hypothetical protein